MIKITKEVGDINLLFAVENGDIEVSLDGVYVSLTLYEWRFICDFIDQRLVEGKKKGGEPVVPRMR